MPAADRDPRFPTTGWLGWPEVEGLASRLAERLRSDLEADVRSSVFVAIPRGGLFVLGMLSYLLDLKPSQLATSTTDLPGPVVVVDDCAISGARLAATLDRLGRRGVGDRVVVGHLLSHPALRGAVEAGEPPVSRCLAADDLVEWRGASAAERAALAERWRRRLPGRRYWLGPVEPVAFPWSAPDSIWWNERERIVEEGWHRISPWRALRFRAELRLPAPPGGDSERGPLDLAPGTLWKLDGDRLLIVSPEGRLWGFTGVGLDLWRGLLAFGDEELTVRYLSSLYEAGAERLARDVRELVDTVADRGLLAGARPPEPPDS